MIDERVECPNCGSTETVKVWDGSRYEDKMGVSVPPEPDYLGCRNCDADMIRLKDDRD